MGTRLSMTMLGLLLVLIAVPQHPAPSLAAVLGTAHEQAVGWQDACSACHIRFKSYGERLWPMSMNGSEDHFGIVGLMCYYCHGAGGGADLTNAVQPLIMDTTIGAFSHGRDSFRIPSSVDTIDRSLPYGNDAVFQCTTCHDPHDDTNKPFLEDDIDLLCARCHKLRQFVGGSDTPREGAWGETHYGTNNPGSHPMGTDVYDDHDATADSPIDLTTAGVFNLAYDAGAPSTHNLGGHLIDGATTPGVGYGITCVTCHAVHGTQVDADPPSSGTPPFPDLLVIEQPTTGGAYDKTVYNGNGDPNNALCEACHTGDQVTIDASTGLAYAGAHNVNPGATQYTHPVDDLGAFGSASAGKFPVDWPLGSSPGKNVSYGLICESCHTPHPAANIDRPTILAASGTHILRGAENSTDPQYICTQCHGFQNEGAGHHPSNVPMGRMGDLNIGDGDAILTCDDCHLAHNWNALGVGLDPDWEPPGNSKGTEVIERTSANTSKECEDCHYTDNTTPCPTNNSANDGSAVIHAWRASDSYHDIGEGTHYLGPTSMDYSLGWFNGGSFDATDDYWTGQGQPNQRWSRFDAETGHVVCESCHELEADKNVPNTALLLAYYNEGGTGPNDDPSGLCEGCHGRSPGGSGTPHPMTGDIVSRTGNLLTTNSPYTRSAIEGTATYPAKNALNCDSCHQPHDADTQGGTYIYDSGEHTSPRHDVSSASQPGDAHIPTNHRGANVQGLEDAPFCDSCHFYLE